MRVIDSELGRLEFWGSECLGCNNSTPGTLVCDDCKVEREHDGAVDGEAAVKRPSRQDRGLRASDAKPPVDVKCDHPTWQALNTKLGCVHSDHGPFPFRSADHHSGLRLVDGVPTRYMPKTTTERKP